VGRTRAKGPDTHFLTGYFMSRSLLALIVVLVVLVGGLFLLAGRSSEKEPVRMEKVVPLDNLAK